MLPISTRMNLYNTIIVPNFDYGDVIFGGCSEKIPKDFNWYKISQSNQSLEIKNMTPPQTPSNN